MVVVSEMLSYFTQRNWPQNWARHFQIQPVEIEVELTLRANAIFASFRVLATSKSWPHCTMLTIPEVRIQGPDLSATARLHSLPVDGTLGQMRRAVGLLPRRGSHS
ncbi:hypothetical protein AYO47_06120 [Planctomyces sp. SCGC AG-212-M04]|nr:hypothetical protein AYO47_06120 [Planctomyces sp. SCGC AG-212-M04]